MIKDMKVIKKLLNEHVEVELPYPFKEGVEIKYITMKDGEQFFSTGGRYVRMLNKKIFDWLISTQKYERQFQKCLHSTTIGVHSLVVMV